MTIQPDEVRLVHHDGALVEIQYYDPDHGEIMSLFVDKSLLGWIQEQVTACLAKAPFPDTELELGVDHLFAFRAGRESSPHVYVQNERDGSAPKGGTYSLGFTQKGARAFLAGLDEWET